MPWIDVISHRSFPQRTIPLSEYVEEGAKAIFTGVFAASHEVQAVGQLARQVTQHQRSGKAKVKEAPTQARAGG